MSNRKQSRLNPDCSRILHLSLVSAFLTLAISTATLFGAPASAQDFPNHTVRLLVGFPPGGGVDAVARMFAEKMTDILKQPVIVENRGGAAGTIAGKVVATAEPDGYTVLVNSNSMVINTLMNPKVELNVERDLKAIASVAPQAIILVTSPNVKANSLKELLDLARTKLLNYGTPGPGSVPHLIIEQLLSSLPDVKMQHVPFQGAAAALTATVGGQIDAASVTLPPAAPLVIAGKVIPIVVTSASRSAALPNVPTTGEQGYPKVLATAWSGFFVPPKTPKAVSDKLEAAILQVAEMPDIKEKLSKLGFETMATPGEKFRSELAIEIATWSAVLDKANLIQK